NGTGSATIDASGVVSAITAGNVTVVYTLGTCASELPLTIIQTPDAISGGAAFVCVNDNTPAFTNSQSGGVWSITNGSGSATINSSGIVTGISAGTVDVV